MTNLDPKLPDPGLGRNPPRYSADNIGMGTIFSVLVAAAVVVVGIIFFAVNPPSSNTATNPPTTTGQGGAQLSPPTAPRMAPAAPSTAVPPIDQNVPAEKFAPPIPAEPRTNN
jgi:hypothetical protein